jgi:hypothetical protein
MAVRSKAKVCGRWLAGSEGSNPVGGMDVCFKCCVLYSKDKKAKVGTVRTKKYG